jgi:signal transduction histidine kinase
MDTPQDQLFDYMLDALIRSMQSRFSFIGTINKGETVMTIYAWSKDTMKECAIPASPRLFPISEAGLWGDCVRQRKPIIVNSYGNSPYKKGTPAGHVPIERFMAVPVFDGGKIVAVAAVANKTCDYLDTDAAALENLTNMLWGILRRRQTSEEIKRKNEELQLLNAEKEKFYGIIAHDLRSPFASLLGFSKILEEELPKMTREQIQKIAGTLRKSATNCYSLLENLLDWSQLQRGLITYNPEPVLLMPKVMTDTAMIMESANKKGIDLSYNIPEDLIVFADENMLGGILRNLASNAVKFTLKGGKVDIAAKPISNEWVEVSFKDTGVGMSKEMIRNLFLADVNTSRRGTEGEPSSGLGLIICKEFIEKHNGRLWIESNEDKGSAFYFTLPSKER